MRKYNTNVTDRRWKGRSYKRSKRIVEVRKRSEIRMFRRINDDEIVVYQSNIQQEILWRSTP